MIDGADIFNVFFRELPVAFAVFLWLDEFKLRFPKTNKRWGYIKLLGYFTDRVIYFFYLFFFVSHAMIAKPSTGTSCKIKILYTRYNAVKKNYQQTLHITLWISLSIQCCQYSLRHQENHSLLAPESFLALGYEDPILRKTKKIAVLRSHWLLKKN